MADQTGQVKSEKRKTNNEKIKVNSGIPDGWKMTTLGEVADVIGGGTPKTDVSEYWNGDIPWLSVVDFNDDNRWVAQTEKHITEKGLKNSATKLLNSGDLIISARGTVGAFAQLKIPMTFNQSCYGLTAKESSNNDFIYYLLMQNNKQFKKNVHGAVFDTITRETFNQIEIFLPTLPEQRAIAAVLSSLDDKIGLLREQNKTLEATAQAIFKEWFVNFNFPSELKVKSEKLKGETIGYKDAGGKMIDSELGPIPEGWRVGRLGEVIELQDSIRIPLASDVRAKRKGFYPYYGATSIMDYIDDYLFDGTYLLLAEDGSVMDNAGRPVLQYVWGKFWVSNHAHVIKGVNGFSTEILHVLLKESNISGIVNGAVQLKVNQANLLAFAIVIPSNEVLATFDRVLQPIFRKIKNISTQIQNLSKLRDTLLPKLMKGEVRVQRFEN